METEDQTNSSLIPAGVSWRNFTELDRELSEAVLAWRNHPEVCTRMVNTATILWEEHKAYVEALKNDPSRLYLCIGLNNVWIGVVVFYNLDSLKKTPYYGYYLKPDLIGSSLGVLLEFFAAEYAFTHLNLKNLKAETKASNVSAMHLHDRFGFQKLEENSRGLVESIMTQERWMQQRQSLYPLIVRLVA